MKRKINSGFTLIELLIAAVVIGILSIVTTALLFNAVTIQTKQDAIEASSDSAYAVLSQITKDIKSAQSVNIPATDSIEITGKDTCTAYRLNATTLKIEKAQSPNPPCSPSAYSTITADNINVSTLTFSPVTTLPENVTIYIEGVVTDSLGTHPLNYQTSVKTRVSI